MRRPITKKDIARWRREDGVKLKSWNHDVLGLYVQHVTYNYFAYSVDNNGDFIWCSWKAILRRQKLGFPKPRRKRRQMQDISIFSMEEMELAQNLMEEIG